MSITNGFCFCYRCNEYVISADDHGYDHRKGDHSELRLLQSMLADCKNQQFGESRTRHGSLIRKAEDIWERNSKRGRLGLVTPADQKRQLQQDRIDTIVVHGLLRLQQSFLNWSSLRKSQQTKSNKVLSPRMPRAINIWCKQYAWDVTPYALSNSRPPSQLPPLVSPHYHHHLCLSPLN